jgi:A/G-specific adenine glycosylase
MPHVPQIAAAAVDSRRVRAIRDRLVTWETTSGRSFMWRSPAITPFSVLVCEILLAKTRAEVAAPVAATLLIRYTSAEELARARVRDLERLLYPLGLHKKRARHLRACARALVERFDGQVPTSIVDLMSLPYVGRYAANAIACVAFGAAVPVIDANVARIYGRVFTLPPPPARLANAHELWRLAAVLLPRRRAKVFNWALLDLGSGVCTPRSPACDRCPIASCCDWAHDKLRTIGGSPECRS